MLRPESWAVLVTAVLGIGAAVIAFVKTPEDRRYRVRHPSLRARLAACRPDERAVIIPADRRRALRRDLPWLLPVGLLAALWSWFDATQARECAELFGTGRLRLALLCLVVLVPGYALIASVATGWQAWKVLRGGYWPPLDTAQYTDTLARAGRVARLRAIGLLVLLALSLGMLVYGYLLLTRFVAENARWQAALATEAACLARR